MINTLLALSNGLILARWALVAAFCIFLYRRFSVPSLPWIAAHYAIGISTAPIASYLLKNASPAVHSVGSNSQGLSTGKVIGCLCAGAEMVGALVAILIAVLVLSEIAFFISTRDQSFESRMVSLLLAVRRKVPALGACLVLLSLTPAAFAIMFWLWCHAKLGA